MLKKLSGPFTEFGLAAGTVYALNRVMQRLSPRLAVLLHDWMVQPITDKELLPARFARKYDTREIGLDDPLVAAMPLRPEVRIARREQAATCLGTFKGDTLIGYIWFSRETYREDEARCDFVLNPVDQSVFDFDLVVLPEHRVGFGFAALWNGTNRYLFERGVRYSYSRVDHFNLASAQAHAHLGWKRVGRAMIVRLWGVELLFSSLAPYVYLSIGEARRPAVDLVPDALSVPSSTAD